MSLLDAIATEITDETGETGVMITAYALSVQFVGDDGHQRLYTAVLDEQQPATTTLGLLVAGAVNEAADFMRQNREP